MAAFSLMPEDGLVSNIVVGTSRNVAVIDVFLASVLWFPLFHQYSVL